MIISRMTSSVLFLLFYSILSLNSFLDFAVSAVPQDNVTLTEFKQLNFPLNVGSRGSLAFDFLGMGPYAGTEDGRILIYSWLFNSWLDYGYTSPIRKKTFCDGAMGYVRGPLCGMTLGLSFKPSTLDLYACDAYFGLIYVGFFVRAPVVLVRNSDGAPPYRLLNSVDAASDGMVYFADASSVYGPEDSEKSRQTGDSTGRLLRYDPSTKTVTTLLKDLGRAVGVATHRDASFVLVSENNKDRIQRYWLKGEKAGTSEIFLTFEGSPNKIKRNQEGNFWVGLNILKNGINAPHGVKINPSGEILAIIDLSNDYKQRISTFLQQGDEIFVAGINITYIGKYEITFN